MNRLLTKRDKSGSHKRSKSAESTSNSHSHTSKAILALFEPDSKRTEKDVQKKVQAIKQRLIENGRASIDDAQIEYALQTQFSGGDVEKAYELLLLFLESVDGIIRPYNPDVYMMGAINRQNVTCYLDSLLFAMFARLGSFEPMLYTTFDDEPRRRLSTLIRLWVNMLRSGKLIQTDITQRLQEALAACGWEDAAEMRQQDTSEAFGFITEKLQLPLLTLEMDIFHEGKGDDKDDHKFINERLIEVAVPADVGEGRTIKLEDCLEEHFNTRVEVVRRLERSNTLHRTDTKSSVMSGMVTVDERGAIAEHVEVADSPSITGENPTSSPPQSPSAQSDPPAMGRPRAPSIVRRRIIEDESGEASDTDHTRSHSSTHKGSLRKEVLMPAWQFFRIIPWYTADVPSNDAQVAAHFSKTRPVLGICLKRYAMTATGQPVRQNTMIDIPLQIALPHFIQDDNTSGNAPLFGKFNLVLQSMVCHRGTSVHSGHYISFIRGTSQMKDDVPTSPDENGVDLPPEYREDKWIKFDDLAPEKVSLVDIKKSMAEEMPYLLFYQVQPLFEDPVELASSFKHPPSYEDSGIGMTIREPTPIINGESEASMQTNYFEYKEVNNDEHKTRVSFSDDTERPRKSLTLLDGERRGSNANTDASTASIYTMNSLPATPGEDTSTAGRLSRAASRFTRSGKSKSRPSSHVDENRNSVGADRISITLSRLNLMRMSKDPLRGPDVSAPDILAGATSLATGNENKEEVVAAETEPKGGDVSNGGVTRSKSKRGRNKAPEDKAQSHHKGKGKAKDGVEPERECLMM